MKKQWFDEGKCCFGKCASNQESKIMTISYDELMDYGPAVIDSLEKINDFIKK